MAQNYNRQATRWVSRQFSTYFHVLSHRPDATVGYAIEIHIYKYKNPGHHKVTKPFGIFGAEKYNDSYFLCYAQVAKK